MGGLIFVMLGLGVLLILVECELWLMWVLLVECSRFMKSFLGKNWK